MSNTIPNRVTSKGEPLNEGELLRKDCLYQYRKSIHGKNHYIYANSLEDLRKKEADFLSSNKYDDFSTYRVFSSDEIRRTVKKHICNRDKATSYCYFIEDGAHIKIGKTNNIKQRVKELQTGNSSKMRVICTIPCKTEDDALQCEKKLQKKFKKYQYNGEWYNILYRINTLEMFEEFGR